MPSYYALRCYRCRAAGPPSAACQPVAHTTRRRSAAVAWLRRSRGVRTAKEVRRQPVHHGEQVGVFSDPSRRQMAPIDVVEALPEGCHCLAMMAAGFLPGDGVIAHPAGTCFIHVQIGNEPKRRIRVVEMMMQMRMTGHTAG